ncbi:hypothetical protein MARVELLAND_157 [Bacillus phage vB_BspM_MarvelLand]|nr:hypothetical protein MARVELLAND_157 [Bacillus phage vB_BspM_MarvelLand]
MTEYVAAKRKHGSLGMLKQLLEDKERKVHGVFYTNDHFSDRYLSRSHVLSDEINIEEGTMKLTISTRVESPGIFELENTLDELIKYEAGDIPRFAEEGKQNELPVAEPISATKSLHTVDLVLVMKEPKITYVAFDIAGVPFTLVTIDYELSQFADTFTQQVKLLFGQADKINFFSHFYGKTFTNGDKRSILKLVLDENITGKAILAVEFDSPVAATQIYPLLSMIAAYTNDNGDAVFTSVGGYIKVTQEVVSQGTLRMSNHLKQGQFRLDIISESGQVKIIMEP